MKKLNMTKNLNINAKPQAWPKNNNAKLNELALLIIDMQNDYCSAGCYMDKAGFDIKRLRKPIKNILNVIEESRKVGVEIIFTRHGEENINKNEKTVTASIKNSKCCEIVKELTPLPTEKIFDKSTTSVFASSDIHNYLKVKGIKYLAFCGNTLDCCVHSSLRSANDLGYKCLLIEDCCGAVNDNLFKWSIESILIENGVFGAVTDSSSFINGIKSSPLEMQNPRFTF